MQREKTLQIDGTEKYMSARHACHVSKKKKWRPRGSNKVMLVSLIKEQ